MKPLTVIDFHSHILPALDHGCEKIEECREQLKLMKDSGTDIAVATSHFYPHMHDIEVFANKVDRAIEKMQASGLVDAPELRVGAEVLLCKGMDGMENLNRLCIRGTNLLLIELPTSSISHKHVDTVENLMLKGYRVLLAHIDRYLDAYPDEIESLLSAGAVAQINAYSLASRSMRKQILHYLETTDKICAIGSDLHGADSSNYKKFVKAQKILDDYYPEIMQRASALLEGSQVFSVTE